jgi:Mg2+/Co2+ transporter CorB
MEDFTHVIHIEYTIIIISVIFLLLSAFFSASETAIMSISKSYLLSQSQQGKKRAILLSNMLKNPNNIITSMLIGNNITNIFFTTLITAITIKTFGEGNTIIIGLSITFVVLVFAEILPKTYAFSKHNSVAILLAPIIYLSLIILKPASILFLFINRILLKLLRVKNNNNSLGTIDNLRGAIEMLEREEESKTITSQEKEMLHSVLDLNDLAVADIMNHRKNVLCIDIDDDLEENLKIIINSAYNRLPVFKDRPENIIGIIHVKDVFRAYKQNGIVNLKELIKTPYFIPEVTDVIDLLMFFREKNERLALIVDEYGSFMGILTLGDILEEITGELKNLEQSHINEHINKVGDSYLVNGDYKIRDLNRKMSWKLPDEEFTTIAGLILYETGKIPNVGNVFVLHGFKFEIVEKRRHQLVKIKITPV